jgi:hypothetical protein
VGARVSVIYLQVALTYHQVGSAVVAWYVIILVIYNIQNVVIIISGYRYEYE